VDNEDHVWMTWAHIAWYDGAAYGSINFAKLKVLA